MCEIVSSLTSTFKDYGIKAKRSKEVAKYNVRGVYIAA